MVDEDALEAAREFISLLYLVIKVKHFPGKDKASGDSLCNSVSS
jgi:hypothetical protein